MHTPSFYRIYGLPLFVQQFLVMSLIPGAVVSRVRSPVCNQLADLYVQENVHN